MHSRAYIYAAIIKNAHLCKHTSVVCGYLQRTFCIYCETVISRRAQLLHVSDYAGLLEHADLSQLMPDVGGYLEYEHQDWVRFRMVRYAPLSLSVCLCLRSLSHLGFVYLSLCLPPSLLCLSACLPLCSVCPSVSLSLCLSACLPLCSVCLSTCLLLGLSVHLSLYLSVSLLASLSALSVCQSVCLSVCLSVSQLACLSRSVCVCLPVCHVLYLPFPSVYFSLSLSPSPELPDVVYRLAAESVHLIPMRQPP